LAPISETIKQNCETPVLTKIKTLKQKLRLAASDSGSMSETEFAQQLKQSLLVLTTSSPDKRDEYRQLFSLAGKDEGGAAGVDLYFTDSGALGLAPRKTPEKTGVYAGNLDEKVALQLTTLGNKKIQSGIRRKLAGGNLFDTAKVNIMGMTEDSGMELDLNAGMKKRFIDVIIRELTPRLREEDKWIVSKLHETGFPGPNFKPLQERLDGGFNELMHIIYDAADKVGLKELPFTQTVNISFVSPALGKHFKLEPFISKGRLLTREEYQKRIDDRPEGQAVSINFVQVFNGQANGRHDPVDVLIENGLYNKTSKDMPVDYARRAVTEYLQGLVGKRHITPEEEERSVKIAFVNPKTILKREKGRKFTKADTHGVDGFSRAHVPTRGELAKRMHIRTFDGADVILLSPDKSPVKNDFLRADPNLRLLLSFIVTAETEPEAMGVPLVVDNRSGGFDKALQVISDASAQGRFPIVKTPFEVAHTDEELHTILSNVKDIRQLAPIIKSAKYKEDYGSRKHTLKMVPNDGVFTVFIGGGHANNSKRDIEDAKAFGYHCAQEGWRIITGAGSVEGSMGATHTGFVQYHLDEFRKSGRDQDLRMQLNECLKDDRYDAERLILEKPQLVELMAKRHIIPREMFFGYSLQPLLEMESPSGHAPPGITYFEAGNRVRRLSGLLASGTKVFLRGGIGTDEEFEETVKQHVEARMRKKMGAANDSAFADGTPDDQGAMIVYNKDGHLDKLLGHYGLSDKDPHFASRRRANNIKVVTNKEELVEAAQETAHSWLCRVKGRRSVAKEGISIAS
jgi:hypothetical protein